MGKPAPGSKEAAIAHANREQSVGRVGRFFAKLLPQPMDLFSIVWVLRIDPKDPNTVPGMNLLIFTNHRFLRNAWLADGVNLRHFGYNNQGELYVRVKWYFPCLVLCARRNKSESL